MKPLALSGVVAALVGLAQAAAAHPVPFTYVDIRLDRAALDITLVAHIYDIAHDLGIQPIERLLEPGVLQAQGAAITAIQPRTSRPQAGAYWLIQRVFSPGGMA